MINEFKYGIYHFTVPLIVFTKEVLHESIKSTVTMARTLCY